MNEVFSYIDAHWREAVEDLIRFCRQPSISAQGIGMEEMVQLLHQMMTKYGIASQILPSKGYPVVYGEVKGDSPFTILFYNHYDVQPPEPLELWSTPPFEPTIFDDKLRARGVSDNKGNIIARLLAIKAFTQTSGQLPVSVKFLIEGEEEIGSPNIPAFIEQNYQPLTADGCIWEGGGVNWKGQPLIVLGIKGIVGVELEVQCTQSDVHSSMAPIVPNAAWRLVWALSSLKDRDENILIQGFYDGVQPATMKELEAIEAMPSEEEELKKSLGLEQFLQNVTGYDLKSRLILAPTCNICGIISGYTGEGSKTVLPCRAKAKLDFRLTPQQRPEDIVTKLRQHLDRLGFSDIAVNFAEGERAARTPLDSPFVATICDAAREVYGVEPVLVPTSAGTGPMFPFIKTLGLAIASSGVEYPDSRAHAPDENIRLMDFVSGAKHIAAILERCRSLASKQG
jgi:acetylornithine deacetylase/succinyl-diaminopimelate desuccinylase-like protein